MLPSHLICLDFRCCKEQDIARASQEGKGCHRIFFKKQNKRKDLLFAWLFGFINFSFAVLHQGPKYSNPAEKRGLADASFDCFGKF